MVIRRTFNRIGFLELNRPQAINALTHPMIRIVQHTLDQWRADPDVRATVMSGAGERGFCAGGDVRALAEAVRSGDPASATAFLRDEFRMNRAISEWPKPIVALLDGVVMGGGIGVGAHASIRVVTERSVLAMPEARIGYTPDVGGTFLLSRMPGHLGEHLAMTSASMTGADAVRTGFADHWVPSADLPALVRALVDDGGANPRPVVIAHAVTAPGSALLEHRSWIDDCYGLGTAADIVGRLERHPDPASAAAARAIRSVSPLAASVALEAVRSARALPDLGAVLEQEWRTAVGMIEAGDFVEGVRAQLVDKDRTPKWGAARVEDISADQVAAILASEVPEPLWA